MQRFTDYLKLHLKTPAGILLAGLIVIGLAIGISTKVRAEGLKDSPVPTVIPQAGAPWTGCGFGGHASLMNGGVNVWGPIDLSVEGHKLGADLFCNGQYGKLVAGIGVEWDKAYGNLSDFGLKDQITALARLGYLVNAGTLAGVHVDWIQLRADSDKTNGWGWGPFVQFKVPNAPNLFAELRYTRGEFTDAFGSGEKLVTNEVGVHVTYKFGK